MKITSLTQAACGLVLAMALNAGVAKAAPISGSINFDGVATTDTGNLSAATAFTSIYGTAVVAGETGNYSAIPTVTPVTFTPFSFTAGGVTPLWTLTYGGLVYSFDATSIHVNAQNANFLNISGTGIANITGMTSTSGVWSITDTSVGGGPIFTFGGDSAVSGVPDSGTTALLIVLGFAGIGMGLYAQRRKLAVAKMQ